MLMMKITENGVRINATTVARAQNVTFYIALIIYCDIYCALIYQHLSIFKGFFHRGYYHFANHLFRITLYDPLHLPLERYIFLCLSMTKFPVLVRTSPPYRKDLFCRKLSHCEDTSAYSLALFLRR